MSKIATRVFSVVFRRSDHYLLCTRQYVLLQNFIRLKCLTFTFKGHFRVFVQIQSTPMPESQTERYVSCSCDNNLVTL